MSTGYECLFFNHNNKFYYLLQNWDCPVGAWDWREYATCYGPFKDEDEATEHLHDNHANPGGYSVISEPTDDEGLIKAAEGAVKPRRSNWF